MDVAARVTFTAIVSVNVFCFLPKSDGFLFPCNALSYDLLFHFLGHRGKIKQADLSTQPVFFFWREKQFLWREKSSIFLNFCP